MLRTVFVEMRKTFLKTFLIVLSALFLVIFSMSAYVNYNLNKATQNKIKSNEQMLLNAERTILSARLSKITGDLIFIRESLLLNQQTNWAMTKLRRSGSPFPTAAKSTIRFDIWMPTATKSSA